MAEPLHRLEPPVTYVEEVSRKRRRWMLPVVLLLAVATLIGLAAIVLGVGFLVGVWRVATDRQDASGVSLTNDAPARAAFKYSILYLFALFAALAVDRLAG